MPQVSKIEYEERIDFIIELIFSGITQRRFILQNTIKKFDVCESQVDKDLKKAREIIHDMFEESKELKRKEFEGRYNFLYYRNLKIQDYRECRQLLDSMSKMIGLNEATQLDIKTDAIEVTLNLNNE